MKKMIRTLLWLTLVVVFFHSLVVDDGLTLLGVIVVLVFLPPWWDPAIQLKEYNERKRK